MKIKPLYDRVLIERVEAEQISKGGIIIPDSAGEKPQEGIVVAVGQGKRTASGDLVKPSLKKGDRVLFAKYSGNEIKVAGDDQMIMREDEILAIIEK